jgi:hypothetical protein
MSKTCRFLSEVAAATRRQMPAGQHSFAFRNVFESELQVVHAMKGMPSLSIAHSVDFLHRKKTKQNWHL